VSSLDNIDIAVAFDVDSLTGRYLFPFYVGLYFYKYCLYRVDGAEGVAHDVDWLVELNGTAAEV
jgi:hypothetical protein